MSYVEVFRVKKDGNVVSFDSETRNNHGGAPLIWDKITELYGIEYKMMSESTWDNLFSADSIDKYTREHKILMLSTCDRVWIRKEIIDELIVAYENFHKQFVRDQYVDTVNQLAKVLKEWQRKHKSDIGIAFNMCSAITPFWYRGTSDRPYNVFKDKEQRRGEYQGKSAWELVEHMKNL